MLVPSSCPAVVTVVEAVPAVTRCPWLRLAGGRGCWMLCSKVFLIPSPCSPTSRARAAATLAMAEFSRFLISSDSERPGPGPAVLEAGLTEVTTEGIAEVTRLAAEVTITDEATQAVEGGGVVTGEAACTTGALKYTSIRNCFFSYKVSCSLSKFVCVNTQHRAE